jgi:hypothetical protein
MMLRVPVFLATVALLPACATSPTRNDAALVSRAQAFMAQYETELRTHDRAALARRYHPDGAWFLGDGHKVHEAHAVIAARYAGQWNGPKHFAWRELTFEPLAPGGVVVLGRFEWQGASMPEPAVMSYSALLRDGPDGLRIVMEDESGATR